MVNFKKRRKISLIVVLFQLNRVNVWRRQDFYSELMEVWSLNGRNIKYINTMIVMTVSIMYVRGHQPDEQQPSCK